MITGAIIQFLFSLISTLITLVLYPIGLLISTALPSLDTALASVASFFSTVLSGLGYAVSLTMLSTGALQVLVLYYSFVLVFPLSTYFIKIAIKWYHRLKP